MFMGCNMHMWFNKLIGFSRLLKYFDYYSTRVDSTHVCKIINEIWRFEVMNTIFLNIPKRLCIFLLNVSWFLNNYKKSTYNIIGVKNIMIINKCKYKNDIHV
jgi:hypothetical protein